MTTTNIYDGLPEHMLEMARRLLEQSGFDPRDLSRVRRVGNKLEIVVK